MKPLFVVGFQRSGTTLIRLMLDSHPDIAIPLDTTGLWSRYEQRLDDYDQLATSVGREKIVDDLLAEERITLWEANLDRQAILAGWTNGTFPGLVSAFYQGYAESRGKKMWGDKDPGNMLRLDQINRWFPASRIIHIIRDGRAACLSQLKQDFGFDNLLDCACAWREEVQWVRRMGSLLGPARYLEIRYEDLVIEPETILGTVCSFLEIRYDGAMLRYHETIPSSVPTAKRHLWPLIGQPPVAENAERWKRELKAGQRICFEKRAGPVLREMGYEVLPLARGAYSEEVRHFATLFWRALRRRIGWSSGRP
ncbi:MAG: sulfotransferase [Gemmatimonadota bacterium]